MAKGVVGPTREMQSPRASCDPNHNTSKGLKRLSVAIFQFHAVVILAFNACKVTIVEINA